MQAFFFAYRCLYITVRIKDMETWHPVACSVVLFTEPTAYRVLTRRLSSWQRLIVSVSGARPQEQGLGKGWFICLLKVG